MRIPAEQIQRARQIAIQNPCQWAEQCANSRYRTLVEPGCVAVLTVNIGEE